MPDVSDRNLTVEYRDDIPTSASGMGMPGYEIINPGAGDWRIGDSEGADTFIGWSGECIITMHSSYMQDGSYDIFGVLNRVDSPLITRRKRHRSKKPAGQKNWNRYCADMKLVAEELFDADFVGDIG